MCTKDYNDFKQGMKGVIIEEFGMMSYNWVISFRDGAGKVTIRGEDMDKHCALI